MNYLYSGMAMYLRNIQVTEDTLNDLARQKPVTVRITNRDGSLHENLCIYGKDVDYLLQSGVRDPVYVADTFQAGEIGNINETNTLDTLEGLSGPDFTFLDGWDETFPDSRKPVIASENGWQPGDRVYREFSMRNRMWDMIKNVGGYSVTLIAVFPGDTNTAWAVMPVDWLRGLAEDTFKYDSFYAVLAEPRELNAYKAAAEEWGVFERSAVADPDLWGDTLSVEDEMYIKTAGEMMETLNLYHTFLGW